MANVDLSFLISGASVFGRKVCKSSSMQWEPAPYVYIDSGSALGTLSNWPTSTSVTAGQKYQFNDTGNNGGPSRYVYAEVSQSGTTSGTTPSGVAGMGVEYTSNTAKYRIRRYHSWARARVTLEQYTLNQPAVPVTPGSGHSSLNNWVYIFRSAHAQTYASLTNLPLDFKLGTSTTYNAMPGALMISASNAADPPVTMTAGASLLGTGDSYAARPINNNNNNVGLLRGIKLGHDNTGTTAAGLYDQFNWGEVARFYDCTFQTYRQDASQAIYKEYGHTGARHSVRCTYTAAHGSNPVPSLGLASGTNLFAEVPTISRLVTAAASVARAIDQQTNPSTPDWPKQGDDILLLGADLSSFSTGAAYTAEAVRAYTMWGGGAFRAFGTLMKSGALTLPSVPPMDITFSRQGSGVMGEFHPGYREPGSAGEGAFEQQVLDTTDRQPVMQRNTTYTLSGGASDAMGAFSYACTLNKRPDYPFYFEFWNAKIDESFLFTLEFEWSTTGTGLTLLTNEDVWLEAAFYNHATKNSAELVFSFDKYDRPGLVFNHATGPATLATSSGTWAGALGSAVKQKVSVVVAPKKIGPIKAWLGAWLCPFTQNSVSSASVTIYVDPLPILTAAP